MKILVCPDIHLGGALSQGKNNNGINSRTTDKIKLLNWVIEQIKLNQVDRIVLTGDVFEAVTPEYQLFKIFLCFLQQIETLKIHIDIIIGNHDTKRIGNEYYSVLDLIDCCNFSYCHVYNNFNSIETPDLNLCFAPFRDRRSYNVDSNDEAIALLKKDLSKLLKPSKRNLLIGHLTILGSLYVGDEIDDYHNELICPLDTFDGFEYVWMGHIHKPQDLTPTISHIGSLDKSNFGESDHQKIILLYNSESDQLTKIPIPTRNIFHLQIHVPKKEEAFSYIKDWLIAFNKKETLKDAIIKLECFLEEHEINRKEIDNLLESLEIFHLASYVVHKTINIVPAAKKNLMAGISDPKQAIKVYAENNSKLNDDKFKKCFLEYSLQILDKYATTQT